MRHVFRSKLMSAQRICNTLDLRATVRKHVQKKSLNVSLGSALMASASRVNSSPGRTKRSRALSLYRSIPLHGRGAAAKSSIAIVCCRPRYPVLQGRARGLSLPAVRAGVRGSAWTCQGSGGCPAFWVQPTPGLASQTEQVLH